MTERGLQEPPRLPADRSEFRYCWPYAGAFDGPGWQLTADRRHHVRKLPESRHELAADSRWPAFFPSPICITTTAQDGVSHVEKVVGASIVNRFPYVVALSYCREPLSARHYVRRTFMDALEASGRVAVQFLMPGDKLNRVMSAIASVAEDQPSERLRAIGLPLRHGFSGSSPVFSDSYLVYECRLIHPGRDFDGAATYPQPWMDIGSHRVYFCEIEVIALKDDIASGRAPLHWRSLPVWRGGLDVEPRDTAAADQRAQNLARTNFIKDYRPDYVFPSANTIAFAPDKHGGGFAVKHLPPLPEDQIEVDNDLARWPCFFPSSLGLITMEDLEGRTGAMSCGSTTILARNPLTLAICISYARINDRYAPRASLDVLAGAARFGCGVPIYRADVLDAIAYLGNVSGRSDPNKITSCGLTTMPLGNTTGFAEVPIHYDCRITGRFPLGTHMMFLGEVEHVFVRNDITPQQPLEWCPWAGNIAP